MLKLLLVSLLVSIITNAAFAEVEGAAYCKGMATALKLPDEKVFNTFLIVDEQLTLYQHGNSSEKYLKHIQQQAYMQGLGAGLGLGVLTDKGPNFAFQLFMKKCYADDYALRKSGLAIEYPKE